MRYTVGTGGVRDPDATHATWTTYLVFTVTHVEREPGAPGWA
jgi:hypothetical protein